MKSQPPGLVPRARSLTRTPWAGLEARFGMEILEEIPIGTKFSLKESLLKSGSLAGIRVLGPRRDLLPILLRQVRGIAQERRFP